MQRLFGRLVSDGLSEPRDIQGPLLYRSDRLLLAVAGRPRIGHEPFESSVAARQILGVYEQHGERFLSRLRGTFALALVDSARSVTLLAICSMAAFVGALLPLIAKRIGVDPAVMSAPSEWPSQKMLGRRAKAAPVPPSSATTRASNSPTGRSPLEPNSGSP